MKKNILFTIITFVLFPFLVSAQDVSFTVDVDAGCAPLTVTFTNTSTVGVTYGWLFEGSNAVIGFDAVHTFNTPGDYTVLMIALDSAGQVIDMFDRPIKVDGTYFESSVGFEVCPGEKVNLYAIGDYNWVKWNLGEGGIIEDQYSITHSFFNEGTYNVMLIGDGICGLDTMMRQIVVSGNTIPRVEIDRSAERPFCLGDEAYFNSNFEAESYFWDFDDGFTSTKKNPRHRFMGLGAKQVTLTVTNICGNSATDTIVIQVNENVEAEGNFVAYPEPVCPGELIGFYAWGYGDFAWDFGDGTTGSEREPKHLYADTGSYNVNLVVYNGCGNVDSASQMVTVKANPEKKPQALIYFPKGNDWQVDTITVCTGEEVEIKNASWDENNLKLIWDMGDGTIKHGRDVLHNYSTTGVFMVKMIAINNCQGSDTAYKWVNVDNSAMPIVELYAIPTSFCPGEKAYFVDERNNMQSGEYTYSIWFGDGDSLINQTNPNELEINVFSHVYSSPGTYSYTFTAKNFCGNVATNTGTITVHQDAGLEPFYYIDNSTASDGGQYSEDRTGCPGDSVQFYIAGGTSYEWHFGDGETSIDPFAVHVYADTGIYNVFCLATNSCGRTDTITTFAYVSDTTLPQVWFDLNTDITCAGDSIEFNYPDWSDLSRNYNFFWDFADGNTAVGRQVKHSFELGGEYFVKLVVTNGCGSDSIYRRVSIVSPVVEISANQTSVQPGQNVHFNNLTSNASSYFWDFGDGATSTQFEPQHSYSEYGIYDVTLTANGSHGCVTTRVFEDFIFVHNIEVAQVVKGDVSCGGKGDGFIDIAVTGGNPPYTFDWSDGDKEQDRYDLDGGIYRVTITDSDGVAIVEVYSIFEPMELEGDIYYDDIYCGKDGFIEVEAFAGTPPYSIQWNNGRTDFILQDLEAGYYQCVLKDNNGCSIELDATLDVDADELMLNAFPVSYANCNQYEGAAQVNISGGSGFYTLEWDDDAMQTTELATGLYAGTYWVYVEDTVLGCYDSAAVSIQNMSGPEFNYFYAIPETCFGSKDGMAFVSVSDNGNYVYEWSTDPPQYDSLITNLSAGIYSVIVEDTTTGCIKSVAVEVTSPEEYKIVFDYEDPICYGSYTGWAYADLIGLDSNRWYFYSWSNGSEIEYIQNRNAKTYYVTVTDHYGCSVTDSITLTNPPAIDLDVFVSDITFYNADDGVIDITVTGGVPPLEYEWSNGEFTQDLVNLSEGIYFGTVTDANGCSASGSVTLHQPAPIDVQITASGETTFCYGGSVILDAGSGYNDYFWNTGDTTQTIVADENMSYFVSVTNNNSYGVDSINITVIRPYADQEICMVTVDTSEGNNLIVWEKVYDVGIVSYKLYKESTSLGVYNLIGTIPFGSETVFLDTASNPKQQSDRYRISIIDTCGNESEMSSPHKTMHLTISTGVGVYNLIWENYEGFEFGSYIIYRGQTQDALYPIGAIQSDFTTYTDYQPEGLYYYQISVVKDDTCYANSGLKMQSGPYSSSFSNLDDNGFNPEDGILNPQSSSHGIKVFPNPFRDKAIIEFTYEQGEEYTLSVYDVTGKVVFERSGIESGVTELDRSNLNDGFYMVKIHNSNRSYIVKVLVN